jgi:hypothetical protein
VPQVQGPIGIRPSYPDENTLSHGPKMLELFYHASYQKDKGLRRSSVCDRMENGSEDDNF